MKKRMKLIRNTIFKEPYLVKGLIYLPLIAGIKDLISVMELKIAIDIIMIDHSIMELIVFVFLIRILSWLFSIIECKYQWQKIPVGYLQLRKKCDAVVAEKIEEIPFTQLQTDTIRNKLERSVITIGDHLVNVSDQLRFLLSGLVSVILTGIFIGQANVLLIVLAIVSAVISMYINNKLGDIDAERVMNSSRDTRIIDYINRIFLMPEYSYDIRYRSKASFFRDKERNSYDALIKQQNKYNKKKTCLQIIKELQLYVIVYGLGTVVLIPNINNGSITISFVAAALYGAVWMANAVESISFSGGKLKSEVPFLDEAVDIFDRYHHEKEKPNRYPLNSTMKIEFRNVSYEYEVGKKVLNNISFIVNPGEKIGIVGINGAGKTTLIRLLTGIIEPTEGKIFINDIDLSEFPKETRKAMFGMSLQKFGVFCFTIGQNITLQYHTEEDRKNRLLAVLRRVDLEKTVEDLPDKENTYIGAELGEPNINLSGGQLQRVSIARAIYSQNPILVFDEPTSSLDAFAEDRLFSDMLSASEDRNMFFVTHQLSFTTKLDRIIVLKEGKVEEYGTHSELMQRAGYYSKMFTTQKSLFIKNGHID